MASSAAGQLHTLQELLPPPTLSNYLPCFIDAGYDDLEFIMTLNQQQWDTMLSSVQLSGDRLGVPLRHGHTIQIMARLRAERTRRTQQEMMAGMQQQNNTINTNQQQALLAPPPTYNPLLQTQQQLQPPQPLNTITQHTNHSQFSTAQNLRQLREERERRRKIRLMKLDLHSADVKSLPPDIDINKPIMDTGMYIISEDKQDGSSSKPQYITVQIDDTGRVGNTRAGDCLGIYYLFSRNYLCCSLWCMILLAIGIVLSISGQQGSAMQGVGTAACMFAAVTGLITLIQWSRRDIHRSDWLDSIECCSNCQTGLDGACLACSCGVCAMTCGDIDCGECGSTVRECGMGIKSTYQEFLMWCTATWLSLRACSQAVTSCEWVNDCCGGGPAECCPTSLCSTDGCDGCLDCDTSGDCCPNAPSCTGPHSVCAELGCSECSLDSCAGCCEDVDCDALCSCDCLPSCEGASGAFNACVKIVCCQCKIQIA